MRLWIPGIAIGGFLGNRWAAHREGLTRDNAASGSFDASAEFPG